MIRFDLQLILWSRSQDLILLYPSFQVFPAEFCLFTRYVLSVVRHKGAQTS